jgi:hypothetical protein
VINVAVGFDEQLFGLLRKRRCIANDSNLFNFGCCFLLSGVAGPMIIDEIEKYARETNRSDNVHSLKISHIGMILSILII